MVSVALVNLSNDAPEATGASAVRPSLADAWRVFNHPDFGPPRLDEAAPVPDAPPRLHVCQPDAPGEPSRPAPDSPPFSP